MSRIRAAWLVPSLVLVLAALPARAELPDAKTFLEDLGLPASEVEKARAGEIVEGALPSSHERELVAMLVFLAKNVSPTELVKQSEKGLLDAVDPNTIAFQMIEGAPGPGSFSKLTLEPDGKKRAAAYATAKPGSDLNLSEQEIASFAALGENAAQSAVEEAVRNALLARLQAYRSKGLDGIAPYARSGGKQRAPAEDLRSATKTLKKLEEAVPSAYRLLLEYPESKPAGTEEAFRWSQFEAHGVPTIVLTHNLYVPDGDAWIVAQRQFYVSTGYNCEQAVAAFIPVEAGTAVFYVNRTSTDQVAGFGGGTKRSIGGKMLKSQLHELFEKARAQASQGGG